MSLNVESIVQRVTETLKTETVIGQPITVGDITLIPVVNVTFGFGAGGGSDASNASNQGSGAGGGARMNVAGMVVVKGDDVSFISTGKGAGKSAAIDKILDALPELLENIPVKVRKQKEEQPASEGGSSGSAE